MCTPVWCVCLYVLSCIQLCKLRVLATSVQQPKISFFFSAKLVAGAQQQDFVEAAWVVSVTHSNSQEKGCCCMPWVRSHSGVVDSHTQGQAGIVCDVCLSFSLGRKQTLWAHRLQPGHSIKIGSYLSFSTAFYLPIWSSDRFHFGCKSEQGQINKIVMYYRLAWRQVRRLENLQCEPVFCLFYFFL